MNNAAMALRAASLFGKFIVDGVSRPRVVIAALANSLSSAQTGDHTRSFLTLLVCEAVFVAPTRHRSDD